MKIIPGLMRDNIDQKMIKHLVMVFLLIIDLSTAANQASDQKWLTLDGQRPAIIVKGGFSGLFPDSSLIAYDFATQLSLKGTILYCDLQLSKDKVGFCLSSFRLDNTTNIAQLFPDAKKTYNVNGKQVQGWFPLDFPADVLLNEVSSGQSVMSRPIAFDGQPLLLVENVTGITDPPPIVWLNVEYDMFYNQNNISPMQYLEGMELLGISYISSPEIGFLKGLAQKVDKARIKLIFKFQESEAVEPTTNQTYGTILKNLEGIKAFASGILVPKTYIWPVTKDMYLLPATSLVSDAHKQGLQVYAYTFANDLPGSYNYSYDPSVEYLQFIDNGNFSVDGVFTEFPPTASEAVACLAHIVNASKPRKGKTLIISHNGASGDYPGCTDLAYEKAVKDGADIIDCSVQMTKDGVAFCLDTADLMVGTNAVTQFMSRSSGIPEIQPNKGIFSFDLTWSEIKNLKPQLVGPVSQDQGGLPRNPAYKDKGKFLTLTEFLDFSKSKAVSGVLINIQNAAYLASNKGLDIVGTVTSELRNATSDKQSSLKVMIRSDDTSVLSKFKEEFPTYQRVLRIKEVISEAPKQTVEEIKKYADAVDVRKPSIVTSNKDYFLTNASKVVEQMHAGNISVHVSTLYNEFNTMAFDYFADPLIEIATLIEGFQVDALVTDFPATASNYMRTPCSDPSISQGEYGIPVVQPGSILEFALQPLSPLPAPAPVLRTDNVVDPPLPPVSKIPTSASASDSASTTPAAPPAPENAANKQTGWCLSLMAPLVLTLLLTRH